MSRAALALALFGIACGNTTISHGVHDMSTADLAPLPDPELPRLGTLELNSYSYTGLGGYMNQTADAAFSTYNGSGVGACSSATAGTCRLRSCARTDAGAPSSGPLRTFVGAGTVTLTGPMGASTMMYDVMNKTYATSSPTAWSGGESFTISASGDTVPAFTIAVLAPSRPRILTPPRPDPNSFVVDRKAGLTVTWTPMPTGTITIFITGDLPSAFLSFECDAATSAGKIDIPATALAAIPLGALNPTLTAVVSNRATTMAGDWPITFTADGPANDDALMAPWIGGVTWK